MKSQYNPLAIIHNDMLPNQYTILENIPPNKFQCHIIYDSLEEKFYQKFHEQEFYIPIHYKKNNETIFIIHDLNNKAHEVQKQDLINAINSTIWSPEDHSCEKPNTAIPINKIKEHEYNQLFYDEKTNKIYNSNSSKELPIYHHPNPYINIKSTSGKGYSVNRKDIDEALHKIVPNAPSLLDSIPKPIPTPTPIPTFIYKEIPINKANEMSATPAPSQKDPFEGQTTINITNKNIKKVKAHLHKKYLFNMITPEEYELYEQLEEDDSDSVIYEEEDDSFGHD
jgi:hypothetical protein